jgi:hypothetical protein
LTNRPQSEVARQFRAMSPPTTYRLAQTVARALGRNVETPDIPHDKFFMNTTMPFGTAGYMEVDQLAPGKYHVITYSRDGKRIREVEHAEPLVDRDALTGTAAVN